MDEFLFFRTLLVVWFGLAGITFVSLFFVEAPYGRYTRRGWGPILDRRIAWVLMEAPSALLFALFFFLGQRRSDPMAILFLALWELHYLHRAFIYPFQMRGASKRMTLVPIVLAVAFNLGNTYINGRCLFALCPTLPPGWIQDPRFVIGLALFIAGFWINKHSDRLLRNLRRPGETGYRVPHGGLFRFISCPNYFGEIMEWAGWAVMTWSLAGLTFAVWTAANLVPRAWTHHRWYRQKLPDYPLERKAVIPFVF